MTVGVPLIQGGQDQQEAAQQMLTAVVLCGIIIAVAQPAVTWLTGFQKVTVKLDSGETETFWTDSPGEISDGMTREEVLKHAMPSGFTSIFDKIIMALRGIAAFVMIVALVWGGVKLRASPRQTPDGE